MTVLPPLRSAGLALLQQTAALHAEQLAENGPADAILAVIDESRAGLDARPTQAEAAISESVFSASHKSPTEMKIDLLERTGKEFGLDMNAFDSAQDYGFALDRLVSRLRSEPGGEMVLKAIERKLGIDELGLNIDDIVAAAFKPDGEAGDRVENALAEKYGYRQEPEEADDEDRQLLVMTDESGLYIVAAA